VNAGAHDHTAFARRRERGRHQRADRREDQGRVQQLRRRLARAAGPRGAERACERLPGRIALARERIHLLAARDRHLADDVRGGAEAVQPEPVRCRGARQPPRPKADQARAQQRRGVGIVVAVGQGEAETLVGGAVLGESAVAVIAGERRLVTEVLAVHAAECAVAACLAEPRDADPLADRETLRLRSARDHLTHDFVARHDAIPVRRQFAVDDVQVGAADAAGQHFHQDVMAMRPRHRLADREQGAVRRRGGHRSHGDRQHGHGW
jgi:hypothetical protein